MFVLYIVYKALEIKQCGMTFIAVVKLGLDAKFFEHQDTAYTEQVFLFDTVFPVAAVELVSDLAVKLAVHIKVCIHQVQLHTSYVDAPDVAVDYAAGVGYFENHRLTILVEYLLDGKLVEVLRLVVGYLLAVNAEALGEVAVTVEKSDGGHIDARVGRFLDIVAGEYAQASGIDFEAVAQTVFHREV